MVITLSEVRHVPELKKNLISFGALDSKGFLCSTEGGVMQIRKGTLVATRGIRKKNMHFLQGTIIITSPGSFSLVSHAEKHGSDLQT